MSEKIERVCDLLESAYGRPVWSQHNPPLDELILTILSQNTTSVNCRRAYDSLRAAFPTWEEAEAAPVERIAEAIHAGGLSRVKAARIKTILRQIVETHGAASLDWLTAIAQEQAYRTLMDFEGVGPKTAACALLFSFGLPFFPVDTHIHRIAVRIGLVPTATSAEIAQDLLQGMVPSERMYSFHLNAIRLGREICRPRDPKCGECVLNKECDFGRRQPGLA